MTTSPQPSADTHDVNSLLEFQPQEFSNPDKGKIILVVAGSYDQFKYYAHGDTRLRRAMKGGRLRYVDSAIGLQGYDERGAEVLKVGTYWQHPNWPEIVQALRMTFYR